MSATIPTRMNPAAAERLKTKMVGVFYLLTLLIGAFFFFVGGRAGFVADVTAAMFYIAATALFYVVNRVRRVQN